MNTSRKKFFGWERSHSCTRSRRVCYRTNAVHELLVHSYTCCSDRHASPYWTFIRRWISMGFTPSLLKKQMTDAVLLWCVLQAVPAFFTLLLRRRVAFMYRTATCRPLFKPWVSLLSTYKTIELCFEFLSHFKVFIWHSLSYILLWYKDSGCDYVFISQSQYS